MPITTNMGMDLPTEDADSGVWDLKLNAAMVVADAHDHTAGKGVRVPSAGININANLPAGGFSFTGVGSVDFDAIALPSSGARRAFFVGNDFYVRDAAGVNIKLTSGGTINASAVGGFGGDYVGVGALADYDDANDTYRFRQELGAGVRQWGILGTGGVDLYEYKAAPAGGAVTTRVRLSSPAALGASYALTFPAAVPGSTALVQVSAAGVMTFSNTIVSATTFSSAVTFSALTTHNLGATIPAGQTLTSAGTTTITGTCNITATTGTIEAPTLKATTATKHSHTFTMQIHAAEAQLGAGVAFDTSAGSEFGAILLQTAVTWSVVPISGLKIGDRITAIKVYGNRSSGAGTITANFRSRSGIGLGVTDIASDTEAAAAGVFTLDMTGLTTTVTAGASYYVRIQGGGTTGDIIYHTEVTYDRP